MKKIRTKSSIDLQLLQVTQARQRKVMEAIGITQSLIAAYQRLIDSKSAAKSQLEPDRSQVDVYEERIQELKEKLIEYESEIDARDGPSLIAAEPLLNFDIDLIPASLREDYVSRLIGFETSQNNYYVVEIFTQFVKEGMYPPKWVLEIVADGFREHIRDPNRDPKLLAQQLGLQGAKSGQTNPWQERKLRTARAPAMLDMATLISYFNVSQIRAAKAVRIKHGLSESPSTLKKYLSIYFGSSTSSILDPKKGSILNEYERTRFVSSFPVAARKFFTR